MIRPPRWALIGGALAVVAVAVAVVILVLALKPSGKAEETPEPTAAVTVATVRAEMLDTLVHAYGSIGPAPGAADTVAALKAAIVTDVRVSPGQAVRRGEVLLTLANAPATQQAYQQARTAEASAEQDLQRVQRLYADHLAASDQLIGAQKALADAKAALAAQTATGAGRPLQSVVASASGVVISISAKPGDRVAQDTPLIVVARDGGLVANLDIQSSDAAGVAPGQAVTLTPVFGGAPVASRLSTVGRQADPATRTIQAIAPAPATMAVGAAVDAQIRTGAHQGLVVPRAAVVFDETGTHLFTISGGKAHRVFVRAGADHGQDLEVSGPLRSGQQVAVQGAYELQDGMGVRTGGQ